MSFIRVQGLSAGYGKSVVLRNIDLEVHEGESVAVVGKNGAGKSTLIMSFFGGTTISKGILEVDGKILNSKPAFMAANYGVTISPQGRMIYPTLRSVITCDWVLQRAVKVVGTCVLFSNFFPY